MNELFAHLNIDNLKLRPKLIIDNWNVIISMVEKGQGYALVPSSFDIGTNILAFRLPKQIEQIIEVFAVYHTSSRKSKALMEFMSKLR